LPGPTRAPEPQTQPEPDQQRERKKECLDQKTKKKGQCRTGHFVEQSDGSVKYSIWQYGKCKDPSSDYQSHRKRGPHARYSG